MVSATDGAIVVAAPATKRGPLETRSEGTGPLPMACSPLRGNENKNSPSVKSLQAKLLEARRRNELLEEIEKGVDSDGYPLCQYRKGFVDHLKAKSLIISTIRLSITQASTILVNFLTEQLELDLKRNKQVNHGEITQLEADIQAEDWENIEWEKRWKTFPEKFATALVKYHAVTLILRSYEYIASKIVHLHRLDKLTTDPFAMSKRLAAKQKERTASDKNERIETTVYMTQTALWANLLPFFADYSLHQGLLCYGYYRYYTYRRQQRIEEASTPADADELEETIESEEEAAAEETRALGRDLVTRSSRLASNRGLGWIGTAVGSGIGSVIWPGWGTLVVSSFGDVVAGAILDDGYNATTKKLEDRRTAGAADEEKEEDGNGLSQ